VLPNVLRTASFRFAALANDPAQLAPAAKKLAAAMSKVPGLVSIRDGIVIAGDGLNTRVLPACLCIRSLDEPGLLPTINRQGLSRGPSGALANQEQHRCNNVRHLAQPTRRDPLQQTALPFLAI